MVDVDKLSDAELRTKLMEFGFPVMPITGTTRKVMTKKLKLLLETRNNVGSTDGRRSLGRYSSEDDSDTDVKAVKNQKNRRVTMAAPVSSTTKITRRTVVVPEVTSSPKKTVRTSTSRATRLIQAATNEFDTGSESESEVVASTNNSQKFSSALKYDDDEESVNGVDYKAPARSYSRNSPEKSEDLSYLSLKNSTSFTTSSPARHSIYTSGLSGSVASDYAADRINQMRSRLSVGSPSYDRPVIETKLTTEETPFLSNFTRRLSALSASKKDSSSGNDYVKEHDTNGGSALYAKPYIPNLRSPLLRGRLPAQDYKRRGEKTNFVSFAVLGAAAAFFLLLGIVYWFMVSGRDTNLAPSGYNAPICDPNDNQFKPGVNCLFATDVENAINLLISIRPELQKRSVANKCFDPTIKPQMVEHEIVQFCLSNYGINDSNMIWRDLRHLELLTFSNLEWGVRVAQADTGRVVDENDFAEDMEQVLLNRQTKVTSLIYPNPSLPYKCTVVNYVYNSLYTLAVLGLIFTILYVARLGFQIYSRYEQKQRTELDSMVEKILDILQNSAAEQPDAGYVVINHVRDEILNVKDRKAKQKLWEKAVKYISENESRVRTEVQTVHGESFDVWRWIGSANLSTSGSNDFKYRPGRRIIDVEYFLAQVLNFPHRTLFFCHSNDVVVKNEIREGFFSIYILKCDRCYRETSVCSEEPKSDLMDVNLAFSAGILSLGLDLYQLNELCSSVHIPQISGKEFKRYKKELHQIYDDSKSGENVDISSISHERLQDVIDEADKEVEELGIDLKKILFLKELEKGISTIEALHLESDSELWQTERKKRLTASNFGRIVKLLDKTNRSNLVKDLLYSTFKGSTYTKWGQQHESEAIKTFEKSTGKIVDKCGLMVHKLHPFLAATPDGIILAENALVEVKCPYKAKDSTVEEAIKKKEIVFAKFNNGKLMLNREDKYYYQVQGQLHVTGKTVCYFIVWTPQGIEYEAIERDDLCWEKMFPKLEQFYFEHLLPELLKNV